MLSSTTNNILVAGDRILGYTVTPTGGVTTTAAYFGMYDTAYNPNDIPSVKALALAMANLEMEIETSTSTSSRGGSETIWLPYPYLIRDGVVISAGEYTTVIVYYEHR